MQATPHYQTGSSSSSHHLQHVRDRKVHVPPGLPSKNSVPFTITSLAERFTPQASVDVHTKTWIAPRSNKFSTTFRSDSSRPPWCRQPQREAMSERGVVARFRYVNPDRHQYRPRTGCRRPAPLMLLSPARSAAVCLLEATKISAGLPEACSRKRRNRACSSSPCCGQ